MFLGKEKYLDCKTNLKARRNIIHFLRCSFMKSILSRERGKNGLFIALVPKFYNNLFLIVGLTTLRTLMNFDWLVNKINVQTVQPLIVIFKRDNFVNYHCVWTSIHVPLSYPFRSLTFCIVGILARHRAYQLRPQQKG